MWQGKCTERGQRGKLEQEFYRVVHEGDGARVAAYVVDVKTLKNSREDIMTISILIVIRIIVYTNTVAGSKLSQMC